MSGLAGMFGSQMSVDNVSFKYNAQKRKPAHQEQPQFPFIGQISLFSFNTQTNQNIPYGKHILCIRPNPPAFQLIVYQDVNKPIISLQITTALKWVLREKIYGYLTDPTGLQWTIQFADPATAARATITFGAILDGGMGSKMGTFDALIGSGQTVAAEDSILVSYFGFLGPLPTTTKQFDANDNYSFTIGASTTIKGWSVGTEGMRVGGTRALFIPPELAYGSNGVSNVIPPNSPLAFLVTITAAKSNRPVSPVPQEAQKAQQNQPQQEQTQQQIPQSPKQEESSDAPTTRFQERMRKMGAVAMPFMGIGQNVNKSETDDGVESSDFSVDSRRITEPSSDGTSEASLPVSSPITQNPQLSQNPQPQQPQQIYAQPTVDEAEVLARMDEISRTMKEKIDALMSTANEAMGAGELCDEIAQLSGEIERKERRLRDQEALIEELRAGRTGTGAGAGGGQAELASLRAAVAASSEVRRENERLRAELRAVRETSVRKLEGEVRGLRAELGRAREEANAAAGERARQLFFAFMGSAVEELKGRLGDGEVRASDVTAVVSDVFQSCSEKVLRQIDEGML